MAISQTMSNPNDNWMQFYQPNFPGISQTEVPSTTITTTSTTTATSRNDNLSPDQGRVAKPIRRRSRASRRTPTTLLNTDTTNFRAMVQQFTGGPTAPFAARPQIPSSGATLNFSQQIGSSTSSSAAVAQASGFHVQYQNQMLQQHPMYNMIGNTHGGGRGGGGGMSSHGPPGSSSSTNENRNYENYMR